MNNTYTASMRDHISQVTSELDGLSTILGERAFTTYEYRAAERTLQVLVEACIGIAKHWSRKVCHSAPADAYTAFNNLSRLGNMSVNAHDWRAIIGMRNALVHDYLNVDPRVIEGVIQSKRYFALAEFAFAGLAALDTE